ncbi:MAG: LptF/LptG family permease [Candidatus Cloacimonetes bacterium]|nr:LptF/LptG family permease [Candidatus Cloacimonadota bacterium]
MKILEKYILKENLKPFLVSLFVVTFVMLLDKLIDLLNLIIEKKLDAFTIASIFGLSLPFILAVTIPMAVLLASIMSFGRLSTDNELVAFKSCGINIYSLLKPTLIAAMIMSLFMVYFNNVILPETNHALKNMMIKASTRRPATAIIPRSFNKMKNFTIYVKDRIDDELYGILIYDKKNKKYPQTISAERGKVFFSNGGNSLKAVLYNGQAHDRDKKDPRKYQITEFDSYTINIQDLGYKFYDEESDYRGDRELSSKAMLKLVDEKRSQIGILGNEIKHLKRNMDKISSDSLRVKEKEREIRTHQNKLNIKQDKILNLKDGINKYLVEVHKKYAIAFACFIFVLIGAPVGLMTKTSGVGMAFSVSSIVFLIYYGTLTFGEELADLGLVEPFLAMWISNILLGIIGIYLVMISVREMKVINLQDVLKNILIKLRIKK